MKNWKKTTTFLLSLVMSVSMAFGAASCGSSSETSGSSVEDTATDVSSDGSSDVSSDESSESGESSSNDDSSDGEESSSNDDGSNVEESSPNEDSSSSENSSDSEDSSSGGDGSDTQGDEFVYPDLITVDNVDAYTWSDYELVQEPTCLVAGIKQRRSVADENVIHQEYVVPHGHDYTYGNGKCKCGAGPVFPEEPSKIKYTKIPDDVSGKGTEYDRYELSVGYYEITMPRGGKQWLSFSLPEPGQYALYSVGKAHTSIELNRYDAAAQYIPIDGNGNYIGFPASNFDGVLYSAITCSTNHDMWSPSWRATYSVSGKSGEIFRFRFVKIADAAWEPKTIRVQHFPEQINGVTAPDGPENCTPVVVPYDTDYFFDENCGYYRMGTPDNPGDIIYVAVTKTATRMLLDDSFAVIHYEAASNMYMSYGTTVDGDYLVRDYIPFICNDSSYGAQQDNCYQNFVNKDGVYPATEELVEFLKLYAQKNPPMEMPEGVQFRDEEYEKKAWLAACYYYKELTPGTEELPFEIPGVGTQTIATAASEWTYYSLSYTNTGSESTITYCTITCNDENAIISINEGAPIAAPFSLLVETSAEKPFTFRIISATYEAENFTFEISATYDGSQDDPVIVNVTKGTQTLTMNTLAHLLSNGTYNHQKYYTFSVTEDGTLDLSASGDVFVSVSYKTSENETTTVLLNNWTALEVKAGDVLELIVGPSDKAIEFDMTISLS